MVTVERNEEMKFCISVVVTCSALISPAELTCDIPRLGLSGIIQ